MPANKNALIRYKTIDNCLRNKYRRWTLEDLVEAMNRYSDFPLAFQDKERQKEENERMERMKSIRGKMKFMLNRFKEDDE